MGKKTLMVGELNPDVVLTGLPVFPSLGKEVLATGSHVVLGSSAAICAAGMARLGAKVDFLGKAGMDSFGDFTIDQLRSLGVDTTHVIRDEVTPTGVTISLTYPTDRALITHLGCIDSLCLEDIDTTILQGYDHLHVSAYFLQRRLQAGLPELYRAARHAGLTTSLDTGHDPDEGWGDEVFWKLLNLVDIFLPNDTEACAIAHVDDTETALRELSKSAGLVVIKCGSYGAMTLHDGKVLQSPAFPVETVDTTGAGDSFGAGFIYAHAIRGFPLEEALRFANACGALSTTGFGGTAAQPTLEQVQSFLEAYSN